jgi:hypothetical protein
MLTAGGPRPMQLRLHRKQGIAFRSRATEILYGGAAGGGKSHLMRVAAIAWCVAVPGLQVYLFRRTYPDLFKNHMTGPGSFPVLLADWILHGVAWIDWGKMQVRLRNGSCIHLCHCQHEKDVYHYQGAEIHVLLIDELTQWSSDMYRFLRSRLRLGGLKIPPAFQGLFPRALLGANPGGIGHNWVKASFVTIAAALAITRVAKDEGGMLRQFIPALLEDNPTLLDNDPDYESKLEGLGSAALVRAMRLGDWDIVEGGFFDDLWDKRVHVIKPFLIPRCWRIDRSFDWGSSKPFSVGWWAESDGTTAPNGKKYPRGTLFRIDELYGWDGKRPNVGTKQLASDVAKAIKAKEKAWRTALGYVVHPGPADPSIYAVEDGHSIADSMAKAGVTWVEGDNTPGSRKTGWERMRELMSAATKKPMEEPGLFVFETCLQFVRTVPVLPRDQHNPEDIDTKAEDHTADEARYRVLAKRENRTMRVGTFRAS